jgi:hypothetical protein
VWWGDVKTTGPVLAIGGITLANRMLFHDEPMDWRIPIATGITAMAFGLAEKAWDKGAVALAYLALVTVLITRLDPKVPSPVETVDAWFNAKK